MRHLFISWHCLCAVLVCCGVAGLPAYAEDYRLGHGDTIAVTVVGHTEFGGNVEVMEDGMVSLPVIGQLKVAGLTLAEATEQLRKLYGKRLVDPEIYVTLAAKHISNGYVLGAVKKPGIYPFKDKMGAFDLLLAADGLSGDPAGCRAILLRKATGERIPLVLADLLVGAPDANLQLADGDILYLETLPTLSIYVTGDVVAPGLYEFTQGTTVTQALTRAQGIHGDITEKHITILRGKEIREIDVAKLYQPASPADLPLEKDDVLRVESALITVHIDGEILHPADYTVKHNLMLTELLALAGGMTAFAQPTAIAVVHSDGACNLVDLHAAAQQTANYPLQQGDRVTVPAALVNVTISGEVKLPGNYRFTPHMQMTDILALAGGALDGAALGSVRVIHPNGAIDAVDANPSTGQNVGIVLSEGDKVVVPTASARIAVLGNVHSPGYLPMDDKKPYKVSEAIIHAGGMLDRSATDRITITHVANGKSVMTTINMRDAHYRADPKNDPLLAPGDIVNVPHSSQLTFSDVMGSLSFFTILSTLL